MFSGDNLGHYHGLNQLAEANLANRVMLFGGEHKKENLLMHSTQTESLCNVCIFFSSHAVRALDSCSSPQTLTDLIHPDSNQHNWQEQWRVMQTVMQNASLMCCNKCKFTIEMQTCTQMQLVNPIWKGQ